MLNGVGQHKSSLQYGANSKGLDSSQSVPRTLSTKALKAATSKTFKMAEDQFDVAKFTEVLAFIGGDENSGNWVKIKRSSGRPITAKMAFSVSTKPPKGEQWILTRENGKVLKSSGGKGGATGPFFHDDWGKAYGWMWTNFYGPGDSRKGTIPGSPKSSPSTVWWWFGRKEKPGDSFSQ